MKQNNDTEKRAQERRWRDGAQQSRWSHDESPESVGGVFSTLADWFPVIFEGSYIDGFDGDWRSVCGVPGATEAGETVRHWVQGGGQRAEQEDNNATLIMR